ncbi:acyl-CoA dehydrogenase family protein [Metabacillus herbersteinensis]|uniref:Acyl-CoA dehydrogenase family protein n=1 Tax=Metabacillus herbersteinensis TaxID=283816 RepID=A0ABV6GI47_9BACI
MFTVHANVDTSILELRDRLIDFIYNELLPYEKENQIDSEKPITKEAMMWVRKRAIELGFYGINLPKELGGQDLSLKGLCLLKEELAKSGAALWGVVLGELGGPARIGQMLEWFTEEQIHKYVRPLMSGDIGCCFALSEPGAGSDANAIQTTAVKDGSDYILNGKKHFISSAPYSDFAIVIAKEILEDNSKVTTAFIVEKREGDKSGFDLGEIQVPISGEYGTAELLFNNCRVPSYNIIGKSGEGFLLGIKRINQNRALWGITYIGVAENMFQLTLDYAKQRKQFGRSIGDFQAIQHMLADMATDIYAAKCMVYDCIEKMGNGQESRSEASMVKLYASEAANRVADKAVQIHGGQGLMKGHPIERMYRKTRMFRILTGTSEIQRNTIARELLK